MAKDVQDPQRTAGERRDEAAGKPQSRAGLSRDQFAAAQRVAQHYSERLASRLREIKAATSPER